MRDALSSTLAASAPLHPTPTPPRHHHRHRNSHRNSTSSKPQPRTNKPQPQSTAPPLLSSSSSSSRWDDNRRYYTDLASKLAEDGRFHDFLMIAESVLASGVEASEFLALLNAGSVAIGVTRLVSEGEKDVVEAVFEGVRKLGFEPVEMVGGAAAVRGECCRLLECGDVEALVAFLETLAGFQFPIKELVEPSDVISLCINKKDPGAAIRYAQLFPRVEMLMCSIILEFGKKRDMLSALAVFEASKLKLSSPNMHAYRAIIDVCGLCGNYLKSRAIYEELLACNVTPNIYVFNSLMNVNARDLNYTLDIYKQMEKLGVRANITSHNILLKSCGLAANVELAQDMYKEIRKLESKGALKLDVFTYSTMIKVFADAKLWKPALEIKEDMVSSGVVPDTVTWSSLISACANAGLVEQAIQLFDEMLQAGRCPNSRCFNILLHACVEACQFDRAFRLFQCWKESSFQPTNTYVNMSNRDQYVAAEQTRVLSRPYSHLAVKVPFRPTTSTYNILMKACGSDYLRAKSLMDEMKTLGLSPNHITWSILIDICGSSGNVEGAIQILRSMHEAGIQPDVITYTTAIKICVTHKNPKLAFLLYAEMKKYQIEPNLVTYNTILRARTRYGSLQEVQQCLAIYQQMRKAGYKHNDYSLKQLVEEWCEGVIQKEHQNKGQFASRLTDVGPQSLLLEKVAEHLQDSDGENLSIDLRGLTKVEARIVVLAVLRMIKEKYIAGNSIKDDVLIIVGLHKLGDYDDTGVSEAVIRLLQQDLGLQVVAVGPGIRNEKTSTRRPVVLQRLKVAQESLHQWLQRRTPPLEHQPFISSISNK